MDYLTIFRNYTIFLIYLVGFVIFLVTILAVSSMISVLVYMIYCICAKSRTDYLGKKAFARAKARQTEEMSSVSQAFGERDVLV